MPEAFAHPAKFSRALIRRIYDHALTEGWLTAGDTVVDPFGGVALGAIDAMWNRLHWVGVELEPRFVALGEQNIALWQFKYRDRPGLGSARILQGDSRQLSEIIGSAELVCSSPPFQESLNKGGKQIPGWTGGNYNHDYGSSPGQLGRMKEGVPPQVKCVVGSPPYAGSAIEKNSGSVDRAKQYDTYRAQGGGASFEKFCVTQEKHSGDYGCTDGQLSAMPEGRFDACISSPPYETGGHHDHQMDSWNANDGGHGTKKSDAGYGRTEGQVGGDTFWSAAREIVAQCHAILKPSGHAIWVCKDFVRKGKRVPFSEQWQALCESAGFRLVCRHRAMLVKHHRQQRTIFGGIEQVVTEKKSFFRRLAEKKGSPRIDFEDVICLRSC